MEQVTTDGPKPPIHVYTSITANYLPKARVLATSLKRVHPDAVFHLIISDRYPADLDRSAEPFDTIISVEELPIPKLRSWIFKHTVVELCTAVKGVAAQEIFRRFEPEVLFYLDPDIAVLGSLKNLTAALRTNSIILTPHVTTPEKELHGVRDNEICALKHGVYNLGFIGIRRDAEGMRFLEWWADRLYHFCYDEIHNGLFTDQRWIDLAPALFPRTGIIRDPEYNVATWNLSNRQATGSPPHGVLINGRPLVFFHFSGFDSGAQEAMLKRYGAASPALFKLREWYIEQSERFGQSRDGKRACIFSRFDDGTPVLPEHRHVYRERADLQDNFPDPFKTANPAHSYLAWFQAHAEPEGSTGGDESNLKRRHAKLSNDLRTIYSSRSWRLAQLLSKAYQFAAAPLNGLRRRAS
jgi:hypothetical protein